MNDILVDVMKLELANERMRVHAVVFMCIMEYYQLLTVVTQVSQSEFFCLTQKRYHINTSEDARTSRPPEMCARLPASLTYTTMMMCASL